MDEGSLERVRDAWRQVLGAPDAFRGPGTVVVARPARPAPGPRWVTVVTLGDARCVLLPADLAARLDPEPGRAVTGGSGQAEGAGDPVIAGRLAHPDEARALLGPGVVALGPAVLAFTANLAPARYPRPPSRPSQVPPTWTGSAPPATPGRPPRAPWPHGPIGSTSSVSATWWWPPPVRRCGRARSRTSGRSPAPTGEAAAWAPRSPRAWCGRRWRPAWSPSGAPG